MHGFAAASHALFFQNTLHDYNGKAGKGRIFMFLF